MPTLPKLPYTDNGTKTSVTAFTGITKIGDGAMYDGLNMCSDYYPNIATRLGFAKVALLKGTASYTPGFDVKAAAMLADGSGIVYIGENKAATHILATRQVSEINFADTLTIEPRSVVSFIRTYTVKIPAGVDWHNSNDHKIPVGRYEYTFYITFIMSARYAIVRAVKKTVNTDNTTSTSETSYASEMVGTQTLGNLYTWFGHSSTPGMPAANRATHTYSEEKPEVYPPVNKTDPPTFLNPKTESVIAAAGETAEWFETHVKPGLYYSFRSQIGNGDSYVDTTGAGIAVEVFPAPTSDDSGGVVLYYDGDPTNKTYLAGAVFVNDDPAKPAGFTPNKRKATVPDLQAWYEPVEGRYTISWGDAPDGIRGAFISGNRMWVYDEHSIYASALGQYEIFTVDGTDNGGWSVTLPGTKLITGGIEYGGRPVFFTEDSIITVYGGYPSAFSTRTDEAWGVEYGSEQSLQLCAGSLYYLSKAGVMRYSGNVPVCISNDLTRYQLNNGRAGADGRHYYLYAENLARDGDSVTTEAYIYVWDVIRQSWHKWQYTGACGWNDSISAGETLITNPIFTYVKYEPEDVSHVLFVNGTDKGVYAVPSFDRQKLIPGAIIRDGYFGYNDSRRWDIRLGRFYMNTTNMKILKGVHLRARLLSQPRCKPDGGQDRAARFYVRICYDDANAALDEYPIDVKTGFEEIHTENQPQSDAVAGEIYAERNIYIPIQNHRYESFWLDISGRERWEFSGLAFEYEASGRT